MPARRLMVPVCFLWLLVAEARAANPVDARILPPDGGVVRSLVIGIDAYRNVRPLKGSVADARDIATSLRNMGVSDVTTLLDAQANRESILKTISDLVQRTLPNDLIVLTIAGHGAQEQERVKGSRPDGLEDVFLLPEFGTTAEGTQQRIFGGEFNHFIKQFELRGAKVLFVADTCHGGGLTREIDPRAGEMSFRQVPTYRLSIDNLKPVTNDQDANADLDLDRTTFVAAVDRHTKAPEVQIPGVEGLRGALSFAVARAFEGTADADRDGKVTLKELFANIRQVVYQLSNQRQSIVTKASPGRELEKEVVFELTRGLSLGPPVSSPSAQAAAASAPMSNSGSKPPVPSSLPMTSPTVATAQPAIRIASLDGRTNVFPDLRSREAEIEIVKPIDQPDLIWDPKSRDVIAWGDVVAYGVASEDLLGVVERTVAVRDLKKISTESPQALRVAPDDRRYRHLQKVQIELSEVFERAVILVNISGNGTIQLLYPIGSDEAMSQTSSLDLSLRVREPFGADQVVAVSSPRPMNDLVHAIAQLDRRRAPSQFVKALQRHLPSDARVGSIGFFSGP